jgi:hypothetical protein
MTPPILPEIYHAAVSPVSFSDPSAKSIFAFRHGNEMHMIRHETVRPYFHAALPTPLRHEVNIGFVVLVSKKGCQSPIPTLRHMMRNAGCYYTSDTSHVQKLIEHYPQVKV